MVAGIGKVGLLRHHVAHRSWLQRWQLVAGEGGLGPVDNFGLRLPGQRHLGSLVKNGQDRAYPWRVVTDRARSLGFQNSVELDGDIQARSTTHTKPFLPSTAVSKPCRPSTRIFASSDIAFGAALRARAISASRSDMRY